MEEREDLVLEGEVALGDDGFPTFMDGDALGGFLLAHFDPPLEGGFYRLVRVRVTLRRLEEGE